MGNFGVGPGLPGLLRLGGFLTDPLLSSDDIHRVVGDPLHVVRPAAVNPGDLKVVTWNIERGSAYAPILATLRGLNADIVLLQEADRYCRRTGFRDVPRELAAALDMNWVAAGEFQEIGQARAGSWAITGQAILSRYPIDSVEVLRFSAQNRWKWSANPFQPRRGGRMALKARTGGVLVYNTHIESGGNEPLQRRQIEEIIVDESREDVGQTPVLIGGDFNNGPILRSTMFGYLSAAAFADALGDSGGRAPTSFGQRHPIDWIFVKNMRSSGGRVVRMDQPPASDHFPVAAAVALRGRAVPHTPIFPLSRLAPMPGISIAARQV